MLWRLADRLLAPAPAASRVAWLGTDYAHRGLHGAGKVENSRSAFAAALLAGLGIECDVQQSSDGRAMVFHDAVLERLTEQKGLVRSRTVGDLTRILLRGTADTIPTLHDLLQQVRGQAPLLIELKTRRERPVVSLCRAVVRDLEGYRGACAVMSFDPRVSRWFSRRAPAVSRGLVVSEENSRTVAGRFRRHWALWQARPEFLAYDIRDLPSAFAAAQRARGMPVLTWTVSSASLRKRAQSHSDGAIAEAEGLA